MKKLTIFFSMLAAALLMNAFPAFSASGPYGAFGPSFAGADTHLTEVAGGSGPYGIFNTYGQEQLGETHVMANKDECLLVARNCPPDMSIVQNRIDRLNAEIAKGTDVYTPAELKVLQDKLNAAYEELNRSNMDKGY